MKDVVWNLGRARNPEPTVTVDKIISTDYATLAAAGAGMAFFLGVMTPKLGTEPKSRAAAYELGRGAIMRGHLAITGPPPE